MQLCRYRRNTSPATTILSHINICLTSTRMSTEDWYNNAIFPIDEDDRLAVIATGDQVRAARKALEDS